MLLHRNQLPCDESEFRKKLAAYIAEREAHKTTVGVPAPFPEFEILRDIADAGGALEIQDDPPQPEPVEPPEPTPVQIIEGIERANPITHRALREFFLGFGELQPEFKETLLYKRIKSVDDAVKVERAKL